MQNILDPVHASVDLILKFKNPMESVSENIPLNLHPTAVWSKSPQTGAGPSIPLAMT